LALKTILEVVMAYFAAAFVVFLCGYLFPAEGEFVNSSNTCLVAVADSNLRMVQKLQQEDRAFEGNSEE